MIKLKPFKLKGWCTVFAWLKRKQNESKTTDYNTYFNTHLNKLIKAKKAFCADTHFYMYILANNSELTVLLYKVEVVISQETIDELLHFSNSYNKKNQKKLAEIALQQLDLISQHGKLSIIPITNNKLHFQKFLQSLNLEFENTLDRTLGYYIKLKNDYGYDLALFSEEPYTLKITKQMNFFTVSTQTIK